MRAFYDNGTSEIVDDYDLYIDERITAEAGNANIEVSYLYNDVVQYTSFEITVEKPSVIMTVGDVNNDGEIDIADAILIMKHDAGLTVIDNAFQQAADVNNDGEIDIADAILIMKYDAGLINKFILGGI